MLRLIAPLAAATMLAASPAAAQDTAPLPPKDPAAINAIALAPLPPEQAAMKSHVLFLAADALKGREAGTPEYDIAAEYVAAQFYAQGLRPAGDLNSYLQKVPLVGYKPADQGSIEFVGKDGAAVALKFGEDYIPGVDPTKALTKVEAPVVFVGFGIDAPALGRNDYKGVDVKGKIVAFFSGAPRGLPGEERAHLGNTTNKAVIAQQKGAIGYILIQSPVAEKVRAFAVSARIWDSTRMTWANADGTGHLAAPRAPSLGSLSLTGAAKLFTGAKTGFDKLGPLTEGAAPKFKAEALPVKARIAYGTVTNPVTSWNVAGLLEGSDPTLKNEVVVLSAHLDHVGVGRPDSRGDTIHNGAMDNAVGIAALIEAAKRFKGGAAPKRSILFLAVTAEEKGLVGADYFAQNPSLAKDRLVANVNLDMPIINYRFTDLVVNGAGRSSLGPIVQKAAATMGIGIADDPIPDEGIFTRSDHYRFVQQGIPSIFLWPGEKGPGKVAVDAFLTNNYHKPSDEVVQDPAINWESGVRFVDVNYRITRAIADGDQRPLWKKGDFFGTFFKGPMVK